jgi:uncharacterized protein YycO
MNVIKIGYQNLMQADIIVTTTDHTTSRVIRGGTGGDVSHALIYAGQHTIVEAHTVGVREIPINRAFPSDTLFAIALRHTGLTQEQRQKVIDNARKFLNRPYDYVGAAGAGVNSSNGTKIAVAGCILSAAACIGGAGAITNNARSKNADEAFFCSELVARAFELAGVKLVDAKPSYTHPGMIHRSSVLRYIGHLIGA